MGSYFGHDKILKTLLKTDTTLQDVDVVINRKTDKDLLVKLLFRGGRLDDMHRAMFLVKEGDQQKFEAIVQFITTECISNGLDFAWEDDQNKAGWPCVKFLIYDCERRLNN